MRCGVTVEQVMAGSQMGAGGVRARVATQGPGGGGAQSTAQANRPVGNFLQELPNKVRKPHGRQGLELISRIFTPSLSLGWSRGLRDGLLPEGARKRKGKRAAMPPLMEAGRAYLQ